jgi:cytochrome c-type biogenesis protein CcmH/NrfG
MRTAHENRVRAALYRLTEKDASPDEALDTPPLLLRTPSIVLLWIVTLAVLVSLLALSRVRTPRADRDRVTPALHR